ncbi:MAG: tRNA uridine-5-carboxymethylaminomethyl(34) synthesis GTPase MnmE [Candidatus Zixiibacteriota bacterium]
MPNRLPSGRSETTIAAVSTPIGRGGIHIVRISGPEARQVADTLFHGHQSLIESPSHTAHHGTIIDPSTGETLDDVVAVVMCAPHSYTCEDTVEISTHGSPYISSKLVELLVRNGVEHAKPGEFTLRAYLNGRLDLSQAEAVADLISARTESSHQVAMSQLEGNLSKRVNTLRDNLIKALSILEAYTDFPEEDINPAHLAQVTEAMQSADIDIRAMLATFETGRILKDGLVVPIVGPPNSGKSSLFNYLLDHDRAIVTSTPGTTRDTISEFVNIGGLPVELIDTAGIRDTSDPVEIAGVARSRQQMVSAGVIIGLIDCTEDDLPAIAHEMMNISVSAGMILAVNKTDLIDNFALQAIKASLPDDVLYISALTGEGIDKLKNAILSSTFPNGRLPEKDEVRVASDRHKSALEKAGEQLQTARTSLSESKSHEFVAFDLKLAVGHIEGIIGKITPDDILDKIFSSFCIGK